MRPLRIALPSIKTLVLINFIVDLIYVCIDPRIRILGRGV